MEEKAKKLRTRNFYRKELDTAERGLHEIKEEHQESFMQTEGMRQSIKNLIDEHDLLQTLIKMNHEKLDFYPVSYTHLTLPTTPYV